jgi:hypothetical protein
LTRRRKPTRLPKNLKMMQLRLQPTRRPLNWNLKKQSKLRKRRMMLLKLRRAKLKLPNKVLLRNPKSQNL